MPKISEDARTERRQRIIDAAWACARSQGFTVLTVDDVCNELGLSKGAFYGYFTSKTELLVALIEDDSARLIRTFDDIERRYQSPLERLRAFARVMIKRGSDPATVQIAADLWVMVRADPAVASVFAELVAERRQRLREWIQAATRSGEMADIPENAFAAVLIALGDGLVLYNSLDPSSFSWTNIARVLDTLLGGLGPHAKARS